MTRQSITFDGSSSASAAQAAQVEFASMPAATTTHIGLWSAVSSGTFKGGGALAASKTTASGDTLRFAAAAVTVSIT